MTKHFSPPIIRRIVTLSAATLLLFTQLQPSPAFARAIDDSNGQIDNGLGFHGYLQAIKMALPVETGPNNFNMTGASLYVPVFPISAKPVAGFQFGFPSIWIIPSNHYDNPEPQQKLCPPGTGAADNNPNDPNYEMVFQTLEGGVGIWGSTQFRDDYPLPKFKVVANPDCLSGGNQQSLGWQNAGEARPGSKLGLVQLSNHLLMPPDGYTFAKSNDPNAYTDKLFGYAWMALPLMNKLGGVPHTGNQHWTLFFAAANFKGPTVFVLPQLWSALSQNYSFDMGRGLDSRIITFSGPDQEFNSSPYFESNSKGVVFSKIPLISYPVNAQKQTVLVQDLRAYNSTSFADAFLRWRNGGGSFIPRFNAQTSFMVPFGQSQLRFDQLGGARQLTGFDSMVNTVVINTYSFGLQWKDNAIAPLGQFPQYFEEINSITRRAVPPSQAPGDLLGKTFRQPTIKLPYTSDVVSKTDPAWANHATKPVGPFTAKLADGSTLTYYWYKFIEQPSIQYFAWQWSESERAQLQSTVESIHKEWNTTTDYIPPPRDGKGLVSLDPAMIVQPPAGCEVGWVPFVISQTATPVCNHPADINGDGVVDTADLAILLSNWGPCKAGVDCKADLNCDGVVNVDDLAILMAQWGPVKKPI